MGNNLIFRSYVFILKENGCDFFFSKLLLQLFEKNQKVAAKWWLLCASVCNEESK